jgi:hypothetical protein
LNRKEETENKFLFQKTYKELQNYHKENKGNNAIGKGSGEGELKDDGEIECSDEYKKSSEIIGKFTVSTRSTSRNFDPNVEQNQFNTPLCENMIGLKKESYEKAKNRAQRRKRKRT